MSESVAPRKLGGQFVVDAEYREMLADLSKVKRGTRPPSLDLVGYVGRMQAELALLRFAAANGVALDMGSIHVDSQVADVLRGDDSLHGREIYRAKALEAVVA